MPPNPGSSLSHKEIPTPSLQSHQPPCPISPVGTPATPPAPWPAAAPGTWRSPWVSPVQWPGPPPRRGRCGRSGARRRPPRQAAGSAPRSCRWIGRQGGRGRAPLDDCMWKGRQGGRGRAREGAPLGMRVGMCARVQAAGKAAAAAAPAVLHVTPNPTHYSHRTSLTSSPRAATSVATSTALSWALKRSSALRRARCCMPACSR